ncbi:hypothetical protein Patl1_14583 [Pistacia atlantica]|uniref:Uncharacterized protein n=1 Tax=Pistacia atlantica TaxID=434234 RepID=A0ACC1AX76_9ROSI|nr:hypothetical protein Patl1_14583 [Pistacia atlantica]
MPSPLQLTLLTSLERDARFLHKADDMRLWVAKSFKYDNKTDSVFEVSRSDYLVCETSKPIKEYRDGNTTVELDRWRNYYFISGAKGHCEKGQKLEIYAEVDGVCYWRTREFPTPPEAIADEEEEDHDGDKKDYYIYDHSDYDYQDYDYYLDENNAIKIEIMKSRLFGRKV